MTPEEQRTVLITALVLILASTVRLAWESRPVAPLLPPDMSAYGELIQATDSLLAVEERRRTPLAPGERVDPNRADEVELSRLPGVGPALARRIIDDRELGGPFQDLDALERVPGIGAATLRRLDGLLDLDAPPVGDAAGGAEGPIDLNRAELAELERLPGVGPALAERILAERRRRGRFGAPEDLLEISGIGPITWERLRPLVTVDGAHGSAH
ncbi:MAG: ComEA family DNA-binding protein [Gemmatimonadales bacterium]|nr:MAG: ComEA family DNA-binding protein [Gemmatimonadales bacterium]